MKGEIKLVLFDLDNTILDFSRIEEYSLKKSLSKYGITIGEREINAYREINRKEWEKYENGLQSKDETTVNRFAQFARYMNIEITPENTNSEYLAGLADEVYFIENAEYTLERIKELGIEMGLLTNGIKRIQEKRFEKASLHRYFKHVLTSEEAGVAKPDRKIFEMMLNYFGVENSETVFVGDSFDSDIVGASRSGMIPLWYVPLPDEDEMQFENKYPGEKINYRKIRDLKEVLDFLV